MAEQIMWVPAPESRLFGESQDFRKMSGGGRQMSIFKHVWEYFCQVGAVQISIFWHLFYENIEISEISILPYFPYII